MVYKMLVINPGSTSTKVSYFENEKNIFTESIFHDAPELLNSDPYGAWLIKVENVEGSEELLDAAAYEAFCTEEG